jgi:hypothetical protein
MEGNFHNLIIDWFEDKRISLQKGALMESNHITEIFGKQSREKWVGLSILSIQDIVQRLKDTHLAYDLKLTCVIPLISDQFRITYNVPNSVREIEAQLENESPSLYLERTSGLHHYKPVEEYVYPIRFNFINDVSLYCYYREHRYIEGIIQEWEFSRGIYIVYYPDGSY